MGTGRRVAVFLDRDGVINRNVINPLTGVEEAPLRASDFALLPGVSLALCRLQTLGFPLILVSNQPNYAKGKASLEELAAIHARLEWELAKMQVVFAAFYYCLHHPLGIMDGYSGPCVCRKPSPYFLHLAAERFQIDLSRSWMIGDRSTDIQCGQAAGARTIFIGSTGDSKQVTPTATAMDLAAATEYLCKAAASADQ